jgi:hypothetical protein
LISSSASEGSRTKSGCPRGRSAAIGSNVDIVGIAAEPHCKEALFDWKAQLRWRIAATKWRI